jgi:hypothetical protein
VQVGRETTVARCHRFLIAMSPPRILLSLLLVLLGQQAMADVVLNEFMARNVTVLTDNKQAYSDWIELRNTSADPVDIGGWYLTDTPTNKTAWRIPPYTIPAGGYFVIFASGKNQTLVPTGLHTNFRLSSKGGYLALVRPDGVTVASEFKDYPEQFSDVSYGLSSDQSGAPVYLNIPTPRVGNTPGFPSRAGKVSYSRPGGLFVETFNVTLTSTHPDGQIRYTLDGSVPTESSALYETPLRVERTLRIRAREFVPGMVPGPICGTAYTLVDPAIQSHSSNLPLILLDTYGTSIAQDTRTRGTVTILKPADGRTRLPGEIDVHTRATFEIRGSSSSGFPKQSMGLELRHDDDSDRPMSVLGLPADSDWVLYAPYTDKTLIRDVIAYELSRQIGRYAPRTRLVELYYNKTGSLDPADYRGVYVVVEKIKGGVDRVDIAGLEPTDSSPFDLSGGFILKKDRLDNNDWPITTVRGQQLGIEWPRARELGAVQTTAIRNSMNQFETALYGTQFKDPVRGYAAHADPDAFIDHWWMVETMKNIDGYRLSTFMHRDKGGRLKMGPIWDYNLSLGNADYADGWKTNGWYWPLIGTSDYPWYPKLFQDPEFTQRHADRWASLRQGPFATSNVLAVIEGLTNQLMEAQQRNFVRWPTLGQYVWPNWFIGKTYEEEVGFLKRWVMGRLAWIDSTIVRWPTLSPASGYYPNGVTVTLGSTFPTYYTLDGSDPRLVGGAVSGSARTYSAPFRVDASTRVIARSRNGTKWSPPVIANYATTVPPLRISEIMYHPPDDPKGLRDSNDYEFLEVRNIGSDPITLAGAQLSAGIEFTFATNSLPLLPGENAVVVRNPEAFVERYGRSARIEGTFSGQLNNAGETLVFTGPWGEPLEAFTYDDAPFPTTDGQGRSLVRQFPSGAWSASIVVGGTPGWEDVPAADLKVVVVDHPISTPGMMRLVVTVTAGQSYSVESTLNPVEGPWTPGPRITPQPKSGRVEVLVPEQLDGSRFFRVVSPRID